MNAHFIRGILLCAVLTLVFELAGCGGKGPVVAPGSSVTPTSTTYTPMVETIEVPFSEIKIGGLLPLSGYAAAWGVPVKAGMDAEFAYINDHGGIYGRTIKFIVEDDQYSGPLASELVRKLVEQDKVFAIMGSLGSAAHSAVWKYLEANGVPDMFILSGDSKWTDPAVKSRFGFIIRYLDEGRILGQYIAANFAGKKLGIIEQNDDFGKEGEEGLREGIKDANMQVAVETYEETQGDLIAQVQRLKNENVDVIAAYAEPIQVASAIKAAHETLGWNVPFVITGVDAAEVVGALAGYENIAGTVSVIFGYQAFQTDIPGIAKHHEIMATYAPGVKPSNLTLAGAAVAQMMAWTLEQTGPNLTRTSLENAAASMCKWQCPVCIEPSSTSTTDHRSIEVEMYVRATGEGDDFRWQPFGDPHGFESTKSCVVPTPPAGYENQPKVE